MNSQLHLGIVSIGLDTYWPQFPGLRQRLGEYNARVASKLPRDGSEIVNLGLIDSPQRSLEAGARTEAGRCRYPIHAHLYLCPFFDGTPDGASSQSAGDPAESLARVYDSTMLHSTPWETVPG